VTANVQVAAVLVSLGLLLLVVELVRRHQLSEEHSLLWILCALALCRPGVAHAQTVPAHFDDQLVARGLEFPTNAAFLPDGRLLVTEQTTGRIRIVIVDRAPGVAGIVDSLRTPSI